MQEFGVLIQRAYEENAPIALTPIDVLSNIFGQINGKTLLFNFSTMQSYNPRGDKFGDNSGEFKGLLFPRTETHYSERLKRDQTSTIQQNISFRDMAWDLAKLITQNYTDYINLSGQIIVVIPNTSTATTLSSNSLEYEISPIPNSPQQKLKIRFVKLTEAQNQRWIK